MSDYINRQMAIEALDAVPYDDMLSDEGSVGESFRAKKDKVAIESVPIADVVPVVRCNDCVVQRICRFAQWLGVNGYCSQGESKDGEQE